MDKLNVDPSMHYIKGDYSDKSDKWYVNGENMITEKVPIQLDLELNTDCNLRCIMCLQSKQKVKLERLRFDDVKRILSEAFLKGLESIKLNYRGEPTVSDIFLETIVYAKKLGIYVHFNTNGNLITPIIAQKLVQHKVDKVIFSVDSCDEAVYANIRRGGSLMNVIKSIIMINTFKAVSQASKPLIRVQAVKQDFNREEIESGKYFKFWERLVPEFAWEDEFDFMDNSYDATELPNWHCAQLWQRLVILADGRVMPCCGGYDYLSDEPWVVGNIHESTIEEIWNMPKLVEARQRHKEGLSHYIETCCKCRVRKLVLKKMNSEPYKLWNKPVTINKEGKIEYDINWEEEKK